MAIIISFILGAVFLYLYMLNFGKELEAVGIFDRAWFGLGLLSIAFGVKLLKDGLELGLK